ncbi:MAG: beta-N-acetylhexosaminidase [Paracoccus sp. (in: a-proteobacteria)]|nr:beta-N-acetylhexosaminidase [Paracoccus sp. (in: a-proteobacteria)]
MTAAAILGLAGPELTPAERDFFRAADPWGFILFGRNIDRPEQLRRLTADLRDAVGRDAVITIDQEGGRVQRLRAPSWSEWVPPLEDAARGAEAMRLRYRLIGQELRAVGIDSNCAPVLDIASDETHPFLQNRCLGRDADQVARLGRAAAEGMLAAGVLPVIKHIPGHGRARADSHMETPQVAASHAALAAHDFAPFRALNDMPMAMSAHIRFSLLDDRPATVSPVLIGLIRDEIGFDGLLMTDDISMNGLTGTLAERSAAAIAAGCDLVLHCNGEMAGMEEVVAHAGALTGAAAARAGRALEWRRPPDGVPAADLWAEYHALGGAAPA